MFRFDPTAFARLALAASLDVARPVGSTEPAPLSSPPRGVLRLVRADEPAPVALEPAPKVAPVALEPALDPLEPPPAGSTITRDVASPDYTRKGVRYPGRIDKGHHVAVIPKVSIVCFGIEDNRTRLDPATGRRVHEPYPYRVAFKVGDVAAYGGMNLTYTGRIESIGAKTVTIVDGSTRTRLDLQAFSSLNRDFNLARIERRNAEWMD